ncbi:MAG: hypothetical protein ACE5IK_09410 [Acidobacteriota bacterium]
MYRKTAFLAVVLLGALSATTATAAVVNVDATALTNTEFLIPGQTGRLDGTVVQPIDLAPGAYHFQVGAARVGDFHFRVTALGTIDYDAAFDGFLSGRGTDTLVVRGYDINFDATGLSTTGILLLVFGETLQDSTSILSLTLVPEAGYRFTVGAALTGNFHFNVDLAGHIDYDGEFDPFLSGRGTDTLTVVGYPVQIDATSLSNSDFRIPDAFGLRDTNLPTAMVQPLQLVPAKYKFLVGAAQVADFRWEVDRTGAIQYDAVFDGFLGGRATDTLVVAGHTVQVDATALSGTGFRFADTFGLRDANVDSSVVQAFTLVPLQGRYRIQVGGGNVGLFRWNLDNAGNLTYDTAHDGFLAGRGSHTLTVNGYPITIDATALGPGNFHVFNVFGLAPLPTAAVQPLTLVPTPRYLFVFQTALRVRFVVTGAGTIEYDPSLDICVSGRGTSHMIVWCDPGDPPSAEQLILDLQNYIASLADVDFRNGNGNLANALINKLDAVLAMIDAAAMETDPVLQDLLLQDAVDKLQNDLLAKTDGCAAGGAPDANDWVADCAVQEVLFAEINRILIAVAALI